MSEPTWIADDRTERYDDEIAAYEQVTRGDPACFSILWPETVEEQEDE